MKKVSLFATAIATFLLSACGGGKSSSDAQAVDSVKVDTPKVIVPHPDTTYASVKNLKAIKIDTFLKDVPGKLESYENLYADVDGILTFRGGPSRETPFAGKVKGTPSTVKVDWVFNTGNGMTGRWGGGSGWTGQPRTSLWIHRQQYHPLRS